MSLKLTETQIGSSAPTTDYPNEERFWRNYVNNNALDLNYWNYLSDGFRPVVPLKTVLDFGADNTGVNDCSQAIEAALDYSPILIFEPGTYFIDKIQGVSLPDNTIVLGNNAVIEANSWNPDSTYSYREIFVITGSSNVKIYDLHFKCKGQCTKYDYADAACSAAGTQSSNIRAILAQNTTLQQDALEVVGCSFTNMAYAIKGSFVQGVKLSRCTARNCTMSFFFNDGQDFFLNDIYSNRSAYDEDDCSLIHHLYFSSCDNINCNNIECIGGLKGETFKTAEGCNNINLSNFRIDFAGSFFLYNASNVNVNNVVARHVSNEILFKIAGNADAILNISNVTLDNSDDNWKICNLLHHNDLGNGGIVNLSGVTTIGRVSIRPESFTHVSISNSSFINFFGTDVSVVTPSTNFIYLRSTGQGGRLNIDNCFFQQTAEKQAANTIMIVNQLPYSSMKVFVTNCKFDCDYSTKSYALFTNSNADGHVFLSNNILSSKFLELQQSTSVGTFSCDNELKLGDSPSELPRYIQQYHHFVDVQGGSALQYSNKNRFMNFGGSYAPPATPALQIETTDIQDQTYVLTVKNSLSGCTPPCTIIISTEGSETIDGSTNNYPLAEGETVKFISDGSGTNLITLSP